MKYSETWASLRIAPCQKLIPDGETPGNKSLRIGSINCDVSFDDIMSVEARYMQSSQTTMGVQYSSVIFFTGRVTSTGGSGPRRHFRRSRTVLAGRVESKSSLRFPF